MSKEAAIRWIAQELPGSLQEKRVCGGGACGGPVEGMYNKCWNIYSFISKGYTIIDNCKYIYFLLHIFRA